MLVLRISRFYEDSSLTTTRSQANSDESYCKKTVGYIGSKQTVYDNGCIRFFAYFDPIALLGYNLAYFIKAEIHLFDIPYHQILLELN